MGVLGDIIRGIHTARRYGKAAVFGYHGEVFIVVAQVRSISENEFVCIRTNQHGDMLALVIVTIGEYAGLHAELVRISDTPRYVENGATIDISSMVVMVVTAYERIGGGFEDEQDVLSAIDDLTMQVFRTAQAAGVFNNEASYLHLMEVGASLRPRWWLRWQHRARHYERLRQACRMDESESFEAYALAIMRDLAIETLADRQRQRDALGAAV